MEREALKRLDRAHVWHPYTSIDEWDKTDPIVVDRAEKSFLYDVDGSRFIDGNSSWWVASLGHGHPRLLRVLREQSEKLAHCALAGITHEPAALLAADLVRVAPKGLSRVFYTDNGSSSVEAAIKIALQTWRQRGVSSNTRKSRFVALDGAFHGDTLGATSLGGVDVFKRPFADVLFDCVHAPFPEEDAYERAANVITDIVKREKDTLAAIVVEPLVQGAAGMRMYPPAILKALREVTKANDVLFIVDEVFTGYGRTGTMWACDQAGITPDVLCIGKAFSALLPMGATMVTEDVFRAFRGGKENTLYYGHTFCGNPLGAALAREVLAIHEEEHIIERTKPKAEKIRRAFEALRDLPNVERVRTLGMIGAADLRPGTRGTGYLGGGGWRVYEEARKRGAYLRPLGDTVYVCPPLTIEDDVLDELLDTLRASVEAVR